MCGKQTVGVAKIKRLSALEAASIEQDTDREGLSLCQIRCADDLSVLKSIGALKQALYNPFGT